MAKYKVPYMQAVLHRVGGKFYRGDHNFKYTAKLRDSGKFSAVFSLMNEYGEIVDQWVTESKEFTELQPHMAELTVRLASFGLEVKHSLNIDVCVHHVTCHLAHANTCYVNL
jgi:hypothetical protein